MVPGGQHPLGPRRMKSNCCGQAEAGPQFGGWGRPTRRSGQAAGLQADSWPGRGPVRTGVSSASGSSWGRGSSARSSARGGSCWAPPWTQLEHLQVPLLVPSPARSTQGRAEGTVDRQPTTRKGLRAPPVTLSFTDGETEAQTGSGQRHSGRARLALSRTAQSARCLLLVHGPGRRGQCPRVLL